MIKRLKIMMKTRRFFKLSTCGLGTKFDEGSACVNLANDKTRIVIGKNCFIRGIIKVDKNGKIFIGNNSYIGGNSVVGSADNIRIGENVIISTDVHIYDNNNHPTSPIKREYMCQHADYFGQEWQWSESAHKQVEIGDNVWIGERSTILKGVNIGKGSIVACNSVVTHDVPEYVVVAGNPACVVKNLENRHEKK